MTPPIVIVVPGDDPPQIADSPQLERLRPFGQVRVYRSRPASTDEKIERARGAQVIINSRGIVTWRQTELESLPGLRLIATCSIGTDMIDLQVARQRGIVVSNQPGRTAPVVAEHMVGLMFALAKKVVFQTTQLRAGNWTRAVNATLRGKTLGLIGTGHIGAEMAHWGRAMGMRVVAWTFHPDAARAQALGLTYLSLDEVLGRADVVSLHVRLSEQTRHLIGRRELALMRPGSLLLNGARGDVVDLDAVVDSLDAGHLGGAGLDVFPEEPLPPHHPILRCAHVALTPHAADQTPEGIELLNEGAVDNVIAFLQGQPRHNVAV